MANFWHQLPKGFSVLAPMEDVTDFAFREIVATKLPKADVLFTEFTSADGLFSKGYDITVRKFKFSEVQRPIVAQIFGTNVENMRKAATLTSELGFDGVDINMGCPVREVVTRGAGAGMIKNPTLAAEIIAAVKEGAKDIPVSVKTRIGYETVITEEWIPFLLKQDITALTIHGRTAAQLSKIPADWNEIAKAVKLRDELAPNTIIVGNGDIENFSEIKQAVQNYKVDGVMIGRGIFHNPWAFEQQDPPAVHDRQEYIDVLLNHVRLYNQTWGKTKNFEVMKKFFKMYVKDFRGANELRQELMETHSLEEVGDVLKKEGLVK